MSGTASLPLRRTCLTIAVSLVFSGVIANANPPVWWSTGNPPAVDPGADINNLGMASIGQAKWMASEALRSLDATAPDVSTLIRYDLAGTAADHSDRIVDMSVPNPKTADWLEQQKAPILLGQLKAIARPFYNRLNQAAAAWLLGQINLNQPNGVATLGTNYWIVVGDPNYVQNGYYSWNPSTPAVINQSPVTIGQLKAIFSLRFEDPGFSPKTINTVGDGIPDVWKIQHGLNPNDPNLANSSANNDGVTYTQLYLDSLNSPSNSGTYGGGLLTNFTQSGATSAITYQLKTRLTDSAWQNSGVVVADDSGQIVAPGETWNYSWTEFGFNYQEYRVDFLALASSSSPTPNVPESLPSYTYQTSQSADYSQFNLTEYNPTYYPDPVTGTIHGQMEVLIESYNRSSNSGTESDTLYLVPDAVNSPAESSWVPWSTVEQHLKEAPNGMGPTDTLNTCADAVSPSGSLRIHRSNKGVPFVIDAWGNFVAQLPPTPTTWNWQRVNNQGVAVALTSNYVPAAGSKSAYTAFQIQMIQSEWEPVNQVQTFNLPNVSGTTTGYTLQNFTDDGKVLLSQNVVNASTGNTVQYWIYDTVASSFKSVPQSATGPGIMVSISPDNAYMLANGSDPYQVTPDGFCISLRNLQIRSSASNSIVSFYTLYSSGGNRPVMPCYISSNGTITYTIINNQNGQRQICQIVPGNSGNGLTDDFEAAFIAWWNAANPTNTITYYDPNGILDNNGMQNSTTNRNNIITNIGSILDIWEASWDQGGLIDPVLYKLQTRLADDAWQNSGVAAADDSGQIVASGQTQIRSWTDASGNYWESYTQEYLALPPSSSLAPNVPQALPSYSYTSSSNTSNFQFSLTENDPTYYPDPLSRTIHGEVHVLSSSYGMSSFPQADTLYLIPDAVNSPAESSWIPWPTVEQNVKEASQVTFDTINTYADAVSPSGTLRIHSYSLSNVSSNAFAIDDRGKFVAQLPEPTGGNWQRVNNNGLAVALTSQQVAATGGAQAYTTSQIQMIQITPGHAGTVQAFNLPIVSGPTSGYRLLNFTDDGKVLLSQNVGNASSGNTVQYWIYDTVASSLMSVPQPPSGFGSGAITSISPNNSRMLVGGSVPYQITPDGFCIKLADLQIMDQQGLSSHSISSLYPDSYYSQVSPNYITSTGTIIYSVFDNLTEQRLICQITPANYSDGTAKNDNFEKAFLAWWNATYPKYQLNRFDPTGTLQSNGIPSGLCLPANSYGQSTGLRVLTPLR